MIMTSNDEQLDQLRKAYESGILNESTYKAALKGIGVDIKDSQIGIIGDNTTFRDINIYPLDKESPAETRSIYLNALIKNLKHLPLRGMDAETSDPAGNKDKLELDRVYVELDTKTQVKLTEAEKKSGRFRLQDTRPLSALEATVYKRFLVILGDPGSGKSTFMNHLTYCLALKALSPDTCDRLSCWPNNEADLIPVPVVLRDFAGFISEDQKQAEEHHLWDFIKDRLNSRQLGNTAGILEKALEEGKAVVLLDGLDEIPTVEKRGFIRDAVARFAARYDKSRFIVTCRVLSYQDERWRLNERDFPVFELAPFDENKIDAFISAWYEDLRRLNVVNSPEESEELIQKLKSAVRRPDLWRLAPNPLLLTVMALVHTHKGRLPDARALLYEETVDILLWRWDQVKTSGQKSLPRIQELLLEINLADMDMKKLLWKLAFETHGRSEHKENGRLADIKEWDLIKAIAGLHPDESMDWAGQVIETIRMRAGLLLEREPGVYSFPHRTFQEYLAGAFLSSQANFVKTASELIGTGNFWREVVLLAVGRLVYLSGDYDKPLALAAELCPSGISDDEVSWRKVWMAGEVLVEIGIDRVKRQGNLGRELAERLGKRLVELLEKGRLTPKERVAAGNALSQIGDPRFDPENWYLPFGKDMGFVTVPAGPFLMGSDREKDKDSKAYDDEFPQHRVELSEYRIARYPVTVAQFRVFVKDSGFEPEDNDCLKGMANHPVVWVSWNEAITYCQWLTEKLESQGKKCRINLPTEAQWEKAARGTKGRIYPWGDQTIEPDRANYDDTGIGTISPVGCFPAGASPYKALDMAGNVWEWCQDWFDGKYYSKTPIVDPVNADKGSSRVFRGGSWLYLARNCRSANRLRYDPDGRIDDLGFRVVLLSDQQD